VAEVKLVERGSFREVPLPDDLAPGDVAVGVVFSAAGEDWRVVGIVPHPSRTGDHLALVERAVAQEG
jgi:hypothetical protein